MKIKLFKQLTNDTIVENNLAINTTSYISAGVIKKLDENCIIKLISTSGQYVIINNLSDYDTTFKALTSKNRIVDVTIVYSGINKEIALYTIFLFQDEVIYLDAIIINPLETDNIKKIIWSNYEDNYNIIICPSNLTPLIDISVYNNPDLNTLFIYNSIVGKLIHNYLSLSNINKENIILQFNNETIASIKSDLYQFTINSYSYNSIGHSEESIKKGTIRTYVSYPEINIDYSQMNNVLNTSIVGKLLSINVFINNTKCKKLKDNTVLFKDVILNVNVKNNSYNKNYIIHKISTNHIDPILIEHNYPIKENESSIKVECYLTIPGNIVNCNNSSIDDSYISLTDIEINNVKYDPYTPIEDNTILTHDFNIQYPVLVSKLHTDNRLIRDNIYFDILSECDITNQDDIISQFAVAGKDSISTYNLIEVSKKIINTASINIDLDKYILVSYTDKLNIKSNDLNYLVVGNLYGNDIEIDIDPIFETNISLPDGAYILDINLIKDGVILTGTIRYVIVINNTNMQKNNDYLAKIINGLLNSGSNNYDIAVYDILNRNLDVFISKLYDYNKPEFSNHYIAKIDNIEVNILNNIVFNINKLIANIKNY